MGEASAFDISTIEHRTPVVSTETATNFANDNVDRQWNLVTEALRRDIQTKPEVRNALVPLCTTPVSEKLPETMMETVIPLDDRVGALADRYHDSLTAYIALPEVPDELITPDVTNARTLTYLDKAALQLQTQYKDSPDLIPDRLKALAATGEFTQGLTKPERELIARRYRYARDVKLLALGSELLNQENPVQSDEQGEIHLPSGITIALDTNLAEQRADLLEPQNWEKRRQLKDRVYEISVNGRKYILKERKTKTHTDTKEQGHYDGRTSKQEFEVASQFQEQGKVDDGDVLVTWEKPVGYVEFPDGFQFSVFEFSDGLLEEQKVVPTLSRAILEHKADYAGEYQQVMELMKKYKDDEYVRRYPDGDATTRIAAILEKLNLRKASVATLSFEDFAFVKALRMERHAKQQMREIIPTLGYEVDDSDGYAFRVHNSSNVQLEIVGFDFEYFLQMEPAAAAERLDRIKKYEVMTESNFGIDFANSSRGPITQMHQAAYFALLELEGKMDRSVEI